MHRGNNYGSALQVYALSQIIEQMGFDPIVLDYVPERIDDRKALFRMGKKLLGLNSIHDKYEALRGILITISSYMCYNNFFKKNLHLTGKYHGFKSLNGIMPEADVYMTGSDQVWNSIHNHGIDPVFYLAYAPDEKPKVAYSASFGRESLEEWEVDETRRLLRRYNAISVREASGLNILKTIGIESGEHVLDPTFLLDGTDWRKRARHHNDSDRYVLIYSVEPDKTTVVKMARVIADSINAKVYMVEWGRKPYPGVDKMLSLVDPLMLIDYFDKAEFVVASSFHGTALSLNLNKQFISISPARFNTRVRSILELVGLNDRLIDASALSMIKALSPIDYEEVNKQLDSAREKSISFLKTILS